MEISLSGFQFYPRSTCIHFSMQSNLHITLSILSKINAEYQVCYETEDKILSILSKINGQFRCRHTDRVLRDFQFYPRSTVFPIYQPRYGYQLSILSKINRRLYLPWVDLRNHSFNSIQDQLKTYILQLLMLYSYYLINFSYLQSVSPPNSFQYKIL